MPHYPGRDNLHCRRYQPIHSPPPPSYITNVCYLPTHTSLGGTAVLSPSQLGLQDDGIYRSEMVTGMRLKDLRIRSSWSSLALFGFFVFVERVSYGQPQCAQTWPRQVNPRWLPTNQRLLPSAIPSPCCSNPCIAVKLYGKSTRPSSIQFKGSKTS